MSFDDDDLKTFLDPLRSLAPSEIEIARWQKAVRVRRQRWVPQSPARWTMQLAAAVCFGILVGAALFGRLPGQGPAQLADYSRDVDATFEHSHANLD